MTKKTPRSSATKPRTPRPVDPRRLLDANGGIAGEIDSDPLGVKPTQHNETIARDRSRAPRGPDTKRSPRPLDAGALKNVRGGATADEPADIAPRIGSEQHAETLVRDR